MSSRFTPPKNRKEIYQEQYEAAKKGGEAFFPDTTVRDAVVALLVMAVIVALAIILPVTSEAPADPTSTTYNPRPEWYFLFFFEFLKLFPGWLEPVAAAVIPIVAIILLILIPFLDRRLERRWSQRRGVIALGTLVVLVLVTLGVTGTLSAPARPAGEESPVIQTGREVYREINCAYCHSLNGVGGTIGPDLSTVGSELNQEQLAVYLSNPHAMIPTTLHPKLQFTQDELNALVAYLSTLGAKVTYSGEAPNLYDTNCSVCHIVNGKGGTAGPDLSIVGSRRSLGFLEAFTKDPSSVLPGATMPAFKNTLTPEQIKDIAAYLYSLKGEAK